MSIRLITEIWDDEPALKATRLLVALALADHANDAGVCWPSVDTLAGRARCSARQAHRVLNELHDEGIIFMPEGARSDKRPFVVGRQNVARHGGQAGVRHFDEGHTTSVSHPQEEVPKEGTVNEPSTARRPTARQLENEKIERIWAYWIEITGKTRAKLDAKRRGHIRNALLIGFDEEDIKLALLGVWRSPFHQGENQQRKQYLDLHYALRGKGDESDDTRIEKAMTWAAIYAPDTPSMPEYKVSRLLEDVRYTLSLPHRPERQRAEDAFRELRAAGFQIEMLEKAPWARIRR